MKQKRWTGTRNIRGFIVEFDPADGLYHVWWRPAGRVSMRFDGGRIQVSTGVPMKVGAYSTLYGAGKACRRVKQGGLLPRAEKHRAPRAWIALAS